MVALNVTSLGYAGSIDEVSGARYFNMVGSSRYGVLGADHLKVTITTGDRMLRVLPGTAWAHNIVDEVASAATIQLNAIASGSRWDLVVLRRNPATGQTTLEAIEGVSAKTLPPRDSIPSHPDQPLALVRVQAGQTTVQEIEDLRVWSSEGGMTANSLMVRNYLASPGTSVEINGTQWVRRLGVGGALEWVAIGGEVSFHSVANQTGFSSIGGYSVTRMPNGLRRVDLAVDYRRTGSNMNYSTTYGWRQMGVPAIGAEGRGQPVGASINSMQTVEPLFKFNSRLVLPQENMIAWRLVPASGELLFDIAQPDAWPASTWPWRTDEQCSVRMTYFVQ
ncbi:hypothetical protein [Micrococcus sp. TA1]|uniref:hypothetical protein n=1 Tax=Micrococcus sp. TA1 TaxID=681627 RepID=UPI0016172CFD|nr:hypothetical protein [Micrococcus sp. TA1]MBB5748529.1 hypothetical protein [Micrococcus sp. TA1]